MMPSMDSDPEKRRLWSFSRLHVGWLLFWYLIFFSVLRLGINQMASFADRGMPTTAAAWIALPAALIVWFLVNVKDG